MNNDKCDTLINRFLTLDKNESVPLAMKTHIILCKKCRRFIRLYIKAQNLSVEPLLTVLPPEDPNLLRIMERIDPSFSPKKDSRTELISLRRWISSGCILVVTVFFFGIFSAIEGESKLHLLLFLCFAGFITGYCAFFIGSNLNFFTKKLESLHYGF